MTAYNNQEEFPKQRSIEPPQTYIDSVIKGTGNIIQRSAKNVIVNGDNNYVAEEAKNINIFNSSGCVVSSGVIGVTLINSSGVVASTDNVVYINNTEFKLEGAIPTGNYRESAINTAITLADETLNIKNPTPSTVTIVVLPTAFGHNQRFTIKNNSPSLNDVHIFAYSETIDNDPGSGGAAKLIISYLDAVELMSDGISNYMII